MTLLDIRKSALRCYNIEVKSGDDIADTSTLQLKRSTFLSLFLDPNDDETYELFDR